MVVQVFAVLAIVGSAFLLNIAPVSAQSTQQAQNNVNQVAQAAGVGGTTDLVEIIGRLINIALGFLGIVLLVIVLYAGFMWMTAGGDEKRVITAKLYLRNAIIGLLIIVSAWAIVGYILNALSGAAGQGGGGPGGSGGPGGGFETGAGSLGGGIIESHLPGRDATNIPRNTPVIVTFKQPIRISSLIRDYNDNGTPDNLADDTVTEGINNDAVKIYRTIAGVATALPSDQVRVRFTADRKTFVFRPVTLLGSPSEDIGYTVELKGGRTGVLLQNGDLAFGGAFSNGYIWKFEVGTFVDNTPPKVQSVIPVAGNQYARNIIIQVNFNEAVDPTAATGLVSGGQGFQNLQIKAGGIATAPLDGEYRISNQYRTVEFVPTESCGRNSCGRDIFCLPGGVTIDSLVRAATLDGAGPSAQFLAAGYDGVVDVVGNSLDGNGDGTTQGQGADDRSWTFGTSNDVNRAAPVLEETVPTADPSDAGQSNIDPYAPVSARFDSLLQSSTVNTDNAYIETKEPAEMADTFWWQSSVTSLTGQNEPINSSTDIPAKGQVFIDHRTYASSTEYDPFLLSGIQNVYQNCFNPAAGPSCPPGPGGVNCCQGTRQAAECTF